MIALDRALGNPQVEQGVRGVFCNQEDDEVLIACVPWGPCRHHFLSRQPPIPQPSSSLLSFPSRASIPHFFPHHPSSISTLKHASISPPQAAETLANEYDQPLTKSYIEESLRSRGAGQPEDAPLWGRRGPTFDPTSRKMEVANVRGGGLWRCREKTEGAVSAHKGRL
jgi:hypothetical protein